jgi:hypothetical protein
MGARPRNQLGSFSWREVRFPRRWPGISSKPTANQQTQSGASTRSRTKEKRHAGAEWSDAVSNGGCSTASGVKPRRRRHSELNWTGVPRTRQQPGRQRNGAMDGIPREHRKQATGVSRYGNCPKLYQLKKHLQTWSLTPASITATRLIMIKSIDVQS